MSTTEELLERKSSGSGLESRTDPYPLSAKFGTNFAASGGRSVGVVRSWTQAKEFSLVNNNNKYDLNLNWFMQTRI
jgi:hypothetical protein